MTLTRTGPILEPDQTRVLLRRFNPGDSQRTAAIISRVLAMPDEEAERLLEDASANFSLRHQNIRSVFLERFVEVSGAIREPATLLESRRLLIGAYFMCEYSLESAALFNPSMVPHLDQTGLPPGALRFILSLRATGEGHISSIVFREGILHGDARIEILPSGGYLTEPGQIPNPAYERPLFERSLLHHSLSCGFTQQVVTALGNAFTLDELRHALRQEQDRLGTGMTNEDHNAAQAIWMLARSNYEVQFRPEQRLCERVIFPATPAQRNGIEDARFVQFRNEDGSHLYYSTFTAYDGLVVMPEVLETADFLHFRFNTLNGPAAKNKGMALFPRKIDGRFAMLSRQDNESISLMFSDNVHFWNESQFLLRPMFPWELVQIGNCGPPIETEAGWLVLSHGVGLMREYAIGAFLLDRQDPSKVIGRSREPLITPDQSEREGYVPNVVYSCGGLVHQGILVIPYGRADHNTGFATVPLKDVLGSLESV